jgi:site-specific DNA recombinase
MPTRSPARIALYTRVSTDLQASRDEGSLETQEARLRAAVSAAHEPGEVRMVFREEGESGKSLDRPQLQRLLSAIRAREIDMVMVTRVDRLSRSLLDFFEMHRLMEEHGVKFHSLNEHFDTSSPVGAAMLKLVLVFAELERAQTAERTKVAMRARAERGLWNGGAPPLGYDSQRNGHLLVNEVEAELVRLIFSKYVELRSTYKLARWLNERGHRQKSFASRRKGSTGGKLFSISVLQIMLSNRLYRGEIAYKGNAFPGQHPAIIDEDLFERVQRIISDNTKSRGPVRRRSTYAYLLTGTVQCACGYALSPSASGTRGTSYHYYRCVGVQKHAEHVCEVKQVRADAADAAVMAVVREAAQDPRLLEEAVAEANRLASTHVTPLRERVASLRRDLSRTEHEAEATLDALMAAGVGNSATAKRRLEETEDRAKQLRSALAEAEAELATREAEHLDTEIIIATLRAFDEVFDHLTLDEKREFLRLMLKRVVVSKDEVVIELYEGRRASAVLAAFASGRAAKNANTPDLVDRECVMRWRWLPKRIGWENMASTRALPASTQG